VMKPPSWNCSLQKHPHPRARGEKRTELEVARAYLVDVSNVGKVDLRQHATVRAEENKRNKISTLKAKLRLYAERRA